MKESLLEEKRKRRKARGNRGIWKFLFSLEKGAAPTCSHRGRQEKAREEAGAFLSNLQVPK